MPPVDNGQAGRRAPGSHAKTLGLLARAAGLLRERRLPWRFTQWLASRRLEVARAAAEREILATRPYQTGQDCGHFEVHMLLGRRHIGMCLWSIKSLLHYCSRRYTVVLHDDGSLTDSDIALLRRHLVDAKIFRRQAADEMMRARLAGYPNCREFRSSFKQTSDHRGQRYNMRIFAIRLFDFNLLSDAVKTLVLDADVLFFRKPDEIVEWAEDPSDRNSLYSIEQYAPVMNTHSEIVGYERKVPAPTDLNAGLLCFDKRALSLPAVEEWIGNRKDLMDRYATFEQATYNHLVKLKGGSRPLPDTYSFNYTAAGVSATHFANKALFFENLPRLRKALT